MVNMKKKIRRWRWRNRISYYVTRTFWRVVLFFFGWVPERLLPWWRRWTARRRAWKCRNGHLALVRVTIPVALYHPKRTAIIQRKIACDYCGATLHKTWKGRMTDKRRARLAHQWIMLYGANPGARVKEPS